MDPKLASSESPGFSLAALHVQNSAQFAPSSIRFFFFFMFQSTKESNCLACPCRSSRKSTSEMGTKTLGSVGAGVTRDQTG